MLKIKEELNELVIKSGGMAKENIPVALFLMVWLTGWAFGEVFALGQLFSRNVPWGVKGFLFIWVTFWTIGGAFCILHLIKITTGSETITVGRGLLKISRRILFFKKTTSFDIFRIRELHATGGHKSKIKLFNSGRIEFTYDSKPVRFGSDLGKGQEQQVISKLADHEDFTEANFKGFL